MPLSQASLSQVEVGAGLLGLDGDRLAGVVGDAAAVGLQDVDLDVGVADVGEREAEAEDRRRVDRGGLLDELVPGRGRFGEAGGLEQVLAAQQQVAVDAERDAGAAAGDRRSCRSQRRAVEPAALRLADLVVEVVERR